MKETILSLEDIKKPIGMIHEWNASFGMVEKRKWNSRYKCWDYYTEYDKSLITADDYSVIPSDCCRCCKKKIIDYSETYYQRCFEYNSWNSYKLNKKTNYCKECAIKKATICKNYGWNPSLSIAYKEIISPIGEDPYSEIEIKHMEDGSIIEDMPLSERDKQRR